MVRIIPMPKYGKDNSNAPGRTFIRVVGVHSGSTTRGSRRLHSRSDTSMNDDDSFSNARLSILQIWHKYEWYKSFSNAIIEDLIDLTQVWMIYVILFQMLIEGVGKSRNLINTESAIRFDARKQMSASWSTNNPILMSYNLIHSQRWKILRKTMTHDFKCDDYCLT